jgi:Abnormal spindle-like microcephaly-assoc'd, ASPM-SPD-2-Hydin
MRHFLPTLLALCGVVLLGGCGGGKNPGFGGGLPAVTLAPKTLTFSAPSPPAQMITLTNSGTVPLNITSITASTNFSADSTACAATLAAGAMCVINVTFTPTVSGSPLTGTITFTDNATNSPQTVTLTGNGN